MDSHLAQIIFNLGCAWLAGSLIGYERSYHGRAAGVRTHALVALASSAVMVIAIQPPWVHGLFEGRAVKLDSTPQLVQGVMTGVGFLGAGVIFKEGVSVQGLTTAACIWCTAAIGLLFGLSLEYAGALTTTAVLATLILLRWFEAAAPSQTYALVALRFVAASAPREDQLVAMLREHQISFQEMSYSLSKGGEIFEYRGTVKSVRREGFTELAERLRDAAGLVEYDVARIGR